MKRLLVLAIILTMMPMTVRAQESGAEQISSFDSQIIIDADNKANVKETIVYDFGTNQRRGIFRNIPIRTFAEGTDKSYYYELVWGEVLHEGKPVMTNIEESDDFSSLRIGDPDIYFTGENTYEINYVLSPIIEKDGDLDFINLNITGNEWDVPINKVTSKVTTETSAKFLETRCYTGYAGSIEQNCQHKNGTLFATFAAQDLLAQQGLTINIQTENNGFEAGAYLTSQDPPPTNYLQFTPIIIGVFGLLLGIFLRIKDSLAHRARKKDQTIVPQYEPPKDLSIGEVGLLHDNSSDMKEVTATLIDLAVRGYIKINQTRKKSLFRQAEYQFDLLKPKDDLSAPEKTLLEMIFQDGETSANLKDIDKTTATAKITSIKNDFTKNLESKGFHLQSTRLSSQNFINKLFMIIGISGVITSVIVTFANSGQDSIFWNFVTLCTVSVMLISFGYALSKTIQISDKGYSKWAEIEGLILYLTVAEKDRLKFHDAPEKNPEHFSALLPAAIALGVDKQWAKQFKDLDISQNVNWYGGQGSNFNSVLLANSLSRDFGSVVSSSMTTPSQSSGGFSGGGSSGGGGGGGGGGSW
jgi:uncharacterized membrane protein YgcG